MKRPWHYWSVFCVAFGVVLTAMVWLTCLVLELDRAEIAARRQAELEEDISRALWRMEMKLMPILAEEAARPYSAYQPILATGESAKPIGTGASTKKRIELSPLVINRSAFVLLNFEVAPTNSWSSPQSLTGQICELACSNGASREEIERCTRRLDELKETVEYQSLFQCLPADPLLFQADVDDQTDQPQQAGETQAIATNRIEFNPLQEQVLEDYVANASSRQQMKQIANLNANRQHPQWQQSDFPQRAAALQNYRQSEQVQRGIHDPRLGTVREGVSRPIWLGERLLFVRRVRVDDDIRIQGCVLDWPAIKRQLLNEVKDLLPGIDLEPVSQPEQVNVSRMLAALPAQLVVPAVEVPRDGWSPMSISLLIVWICLLVALIAGGGLLHGVLLLSERRAAFVSAVTHELRTPLTTFRMYSEILAQNMVQDPQRRRTYLETLRIEADRLSHLVENVLSYARLERGPSGRSQVQLTVAELLDRITMRLADRAEQAEMNLVVDLPSAERDRTLKTDPAAVEQILFNLVDNACKYAAGDDRRIHLEVASAHDLLRLKIRDHGLGISPHMASKLFRPFAKAVDDAADSTPGVGLGLALCRRLARELGGRLELTDGPDSGAQFVLELPLEAFKNP